MLEDLEREGAEEGSKAGVALDLLLAREVGEIGVRALRWWNLNDQGMLESEANDISPSEKEGRRGG